MKRNMIHDVHKWHTQTQNVLLSYALSFEWCFFRLFCHALALFVVIIWIYDFTANLCRSKLFAAIYEILIQKYLFQLQQKAELCCFSFCTIFCMIAQISWFDETCRFMWFFFKISLNCCVCLQSSKKKRKTEKELKKNWNRIVECALSISFGLAIDLHWRDSQQHMHENDGGRKTKGTHKKRRQ